MCKVMEVVKRIDITCPECGYRFTIKQTEVSHNMRDGEAFVSCRNPQKVMCNGIKKPRCTCYITNFETK